MSHITTMKTKLKDINTLQRALVFLGLPFKLNSEARLYQKTRRADVVIVSPGRYDIGLIKEQEEFTLFADDLCFDEFIKAYPKLAFLEKKRGTVKGIRTERASQRDAFSGLLLQACNVTTAIVEADRKGHSINVSAPDEHGVIHATVTVYS